MLAGGQLSDTDVDALESTVRSDPADVLSRLKLLGYYFAHHRREVAWGERRASHVLWFIEHSPELDVVGSPYCSMEPQDRNFTRLAAAWRHVLAAASVPPLVILHAARFFTTSDPDQCRLLLERGEREAPSWPNWAMELGSDAFRTVVVARRVAASGRTPRQSEEQLKALAREAFVHFKRALALASSPAWRFQVLPDCAEAALECGHFEEAARYADVTIEVASQCPEDRHRPDRVHTAHIVRGHVALEAGDVAGARRELEAAAAQGSGNAPVLRSFGPDFTLAQRLLAAGEVDAVRGYLGRCATFWEAERVARWQRAIERGEHPRMHTGYEPPESAAP